MQIRVIARPGHGALLEPRRSEPLTFGVPLPRGMARDGAGWTLGEAGRPARAVQTRVLDRWADGTARWVLVDAQADIDLAGSGEFVIDCGLGAEAPTPLLQRIHVSENGDQLTVDTGVAQFAIRTRGVFPFETVTIDGTSVLDSSASGLTIVDSAGMACVATIDSAIVEELGPLRSVVKLVGRVQLPSGQTALDISARVHFFAGLPSVRLLLTLTNPNCARHQGGFWDLGDPGSILIKNASLKFGVANAGAPAEVEASVEQGASWRRFQTPFEIYQDSSGGEHWQSTNHVNRERKVPNTFRGYRVRAGDEVHLGLRATPVVAVSGKVTRIACAMPHFWQNFPRAVEATASSLTLGLFPGQYADLHEIQGGEQKTHECFLSFGPESVSSRPLEWCRAHTVMCLDPAWCISSQAVPFLAHLEAGHVEVVNAAVDGPDRFELKRELIDEYGWRNFGDIYGDHEAVGRQGSAPLVSHYNNQYDAIAGFALQFLRSADPRWWWMSTELTAHVVDIDIYHTDRDKSSYNHGMFWHTYHYGDADAATHRSYPRAGKGRIHGGGPSADHNYTTGLMLHYFLTGDEASRQAVIDLAQFVIDMDDGRKNFLRWLTTADTGRAALSAPRYYGPGRGPANSLNALIDAHRLSMDPRFSLKAEQLIRRVVHPQDDIARHQLDLHEERWFYTMFLQSLGKYIQRKRELSESDEMSDYARASLLHYARWMEANTYPYLTQPEKLRYPTETWAAQDARKSDAFYMAAMEASGEERQRFLERGLFFFRAAIDGLKSMPTAKLARPVVIMLSSGFVHSWLPGHCDPCSRLLSPTVPVVSRPANFQPQRDIAERRLKWLAGGGILVILGLGMWLVLT